MQMHGALAARFLLLFVSYVDILEVADTKDSLEFIEECMMKQVIACMCPSVCITICINWLYMFCSFPASILYDCSAFCLSLMEVTVANCI